MQYIRDIDFEEDNTINDCYRVNFPNGEFKMIYITITKKERVELIEWYNNSGWLITYNEYCI